MGSLTEHVNFLHLFFYVQGFWMPFSLCQTLFTGASDVGNTVLHIADRAKVTFLRHPDCPKLEADCVYLCNHRSWADFFIDQALCGGASYLSRKMVIIGTPVSAIWAWLNNSTWFFTRKSGIDRNAFFDWIDSNWNSRPNHGLIAYPEGTRNQTFEPIELKTGVLQYAYNFKRKVQVVITTDKEEVVNEKKGICKHGVTCVVRNSEVVNPQDFKSYEEFRDSIRELFKLTWKKAYDDDNKHRKDLVEFRPPHGLPTKNMDEVPQWSRLLFLRVIFLIAILSFARQKILN